MDLWSPETLERIAQARQHAQELPRLTDGFLPRTVASTGVHGYWPLTGWAMLSRACGTLDSVTALIDERRATDAGVVVRSLFEQPLSRSPGSAGTGPSARKPTTTCSSTAGRRTAEPSDRRELRRRYSRRPGDAEPRSAGEEADSHWAARIAAVRNPSTSFRGIYAVVYRTDSQATHAAVTSVEPVIAPARPGQFEVLAVEQDPASTARSRARRCSTG